MEMAGPANERVCLSCVRRIEGADSRDDDAARLVDTQRATRLLVQLGGCESQLALKASRACPGCALARRGIERPDEARGLPKTTRRQIAKTNIPANMMKSISLIAGFPFFSVSV